MVIVAQAVLAATGVAVVAWVVVVLRGSIQSLDPDAAQANSMRGYRLQRLAFQLLLLTCVLLVSVGIGQPWSIFVALQIPLLVVNVWVANKIVRREHSFGVSVTIGHGGTIGHDGTIGHGGSGGSAPRRDPPD